MKCNREKLFERGIKQTKVQYPPEYSYTTTSNVKLFEDRYDDKFRYRHHQKHYQPSLSGKRYYSEDHVGDKDVSNLPYYIVPVLYVPYKPLYESKTFMQPRVYKAYHCKSKQSFMKTGRGSLSGKAYFTKSKSLLNIYSPYHQDRQSDQYDKPRPRTYSKSNSYSFEHYDHYFKNSLDAKPVRKSSNSEISYCTEKTFPSVAREKPPLIDFNDLFKLSRIKPMTSEDSCNRDQVTVDEMDKMKFGSAVEFPTWDSPRNQDGCVGTEHVRSTISIQTSVPNLDKPNSTLGTQTVIKDVQKVVLVLPPGKVQRSVRKPIPEEPPSYFDNDSLEETKFVDVQHSESQQDKYDLKSLLKRKPSSGLSRLIQNPANNFPKASASSFLSVKTSANVSETSMK